MKTKLFIVLALTVFQANVLAGTLVLSGHVPERGFSLQQNSGQKTALISPQKSSLKVFVKNKKNTARGPASVDSKKGIMLNQQLALLDGAQITVEAP